MCLSCGNLPRSSPVYCGTTYPCPLALTPPTVYGVSCNITTVTMPSRIGSTPNSYPLLRTFLPLLPLFLSVILLFFPQSHVPGSLAVRSPSSPHTGYTVGQQTYLDGRYDLSCCTPALSPSSTSLRLCKSVVVATLLRPLALSHLGYMMSRVTSLLLLVAVVGKTLLN